MRSHRLQKGIGFIGLTFVVVVLGALVLLGFRLLPAYIQYFTVKGALNEITHNPELKNASPQEIRSAFDKRAMVNDIRIIQGKELEIEKGSDGYTVSANYSQQIPLFQNVSACIDFSASSSTGGK
ncbi:MAG: DUF4845 domain-containing protein [Casimicrobiaceae bacterium]|jgi:Domain of unknown function (DUF4845)